jgi:hypothetical protein
VRPEPEGRATAQSGGFLWLALGLLPGLIAPFLLGGEMNSSFIFLLLNAGCSWLGAFFMLEKWVRGLLQRICGGLMLGFGLFLVNMIIGALAACALPRA